MTKTCFDTSPMDALHAGASGKAALPDTWIARRFATPMPEVLTK
jgi:hypothetical protein